MNFSESARGSTATHSLEGISITHFSKAEGGQEELSNSLSGRNFRIARHRSKRRPGEAQQLTYLKGFQGRASPKQKEARRSTATHPLEGISWVHVSEANGGQEEHSNPPTGGISWGHVSKRRPRGAQQLTSWKGFHGRTSAKQTEAREAQQLTHWKGFQGSK